MNDDMDEVIYKVEYRPDYDSSWRHYYSDPEKADALDMYARHVSYYGKEQCRMVRTTVGTELFRYIPVDQWEDDDE
jgi:hypothetical protein